MSFLPATFPFPLATSFIHVLTVFFQTELSPRRPHSLGFPFCSALLFTTLPSALSLFSSQRFPVLYRSLSMSLVLLACCGGQEYQVAGLIFLCPQFMSIDASFVFLRAAPCPDHGSEEDIPDLVPLDYDSYSLPRYHADAHSPICQHNSGQVYGTDGEMVECEWASRRLVADVKPMAPGAKRTH
ncbi:hypothetical protein B0H13DRAFT_1867872 [Mycena leptocephala]|nr:hypothetical protein B0H13DRAFT_1867872 [Mycena leptocephala]